VTQARLNRLLILCSVALLILAGAAIWLVNQELARRGQGGLSRIASAVAVGGPFELVDHTGATVTEGSFGDRNLLIFFGYTYCPDVCPTELARMATAIEQLGDQDRTKIQPLFITIDPERDTPEFLADYVAQFHPDIVGLTGSEEQIAQVAGAYRVFYAKADTDDPDYYLMDHSSFTYLMAPDGSNILVFPYDTAPGEMAGAISAAL
jgi:protein SCO1/2